MEDKNLKQSLLGLLTQVLFPRSLRLRIEKSPLPIREIERRSKVHIEEIPIDIFIIVCNAEYTIFSSDFRRYWKFPKVGVIL